MGHQHRIGAIAVALTGIVTGITCGDDFWVEGVECTQAIQSRNPPLELIAGKEILVRVTVGIDGSATGLDARLSVQGFGTIAEYRPLNLDTFDAPSLGSVDLADYDDTLNFCIVIDETGPVNIVVILDPDDAVVEDDEMNNEFFKPEIIECREMPSIGYLRIFNDGTTPGENRVGAGTGELVLRAVLPVPDIDYRFIGSPRWTLCDPGGTTCGTLFISYLSLYRTGISANRPDHLFGWINAVSGTTIGRAYTPGRVGWGESSHALYQTTFAHESGHNLGLGHGSGMIDWFGADVRDLLGRGTILDLDSVELMAATASSSMWVDIHEYEHFLDHDRFVCAAPTEAPAGTEDVIVITGSYDGAGATIDEAFTIVGADREPENDPGGLLIARTVSEGTTLDEVRFDPSVISDAPGSVPNAIIVALNRTSGPLEADAIEVVDAGSGAVIGVRLASETPPTAAFVAPAAGASIAEGTLVQWSVADHDGDPVRAILNWSWDDGTSWIPVGFVTEDTALEFDGTLPGSLAGTGRLRLDVSDGFHTTVVELAGLTFDDRKPPVVAILSPGETATVREGVAVHLTGAAYDVEKQRSLDDAECWWTSSVDGFLGSGRSITRDDLTPGTHAITFEAVDCDGMSSSDVTVLGVDEDTGAGCFDADVVINEIRVAQAGPGSNDEFFELAGPSGTPLDCLHYIVLNRYGIVQEVTDLSGHVIPPGGVFLVGQVDPLPATGASPQLVTPLTYFDDEDHTHLLVSACGGLAGLVGGDLDADGDGELDNVPWHCVVDCIGLDGDSSDGHLYCGTQRGPTGMGDQPPYVHRCSPVGSWFLGPLPFPPMGLDTPGAENAPCPFVSAATVFGLDHAALGAADLFIDPDGGELSVANIGSSGLDGVAIDLGPAAEFVCMELGSIASVTDLVDLILAVTATGDADGQSGQELATVTLTSLGDSMIDCDFAFPFLPGGPIDVHIMMDGPVEIMEGLVGPEITIAYPTDPPPSPVLEFVPKPKELFPDCDLGTTLDLGAPSTVTVDGETFVAEAIVVRPSRPTTIDAMTSVTLRGTVPAGEPGIVTFIGEQLGIFGRGHRALGDAELDTQLGQQGEELRVSNIGSSGLDGARLFAPYDLDPNIGWMGGIRMSDDPPPDGSTLLASARLLRSDGQDASPLLALTQTAVGIDTALELDATPLPGAELVPVSYRLEGEEVFGTTAPGPVVAILLPTELADRFVLKFEVDEAAGMLYVRRCSSAPWSVPGQPGVFADEVVLCLPAPEIIEPHDHDLQIELTGTASQAIAEGGGTMSFVIDEETSIVTACPADTDGSGAVDVNDLVQVITDWGPCPGCPGDIDGNDVVDVNDLVEVITAWGDC